jgi:hypothetical protein
MTLPHSLLEVAERINVYEGLIWATDFLYCKYRRS